MYLKDKLLNTVNRKSKECLCGCVGMSYCANNFKQSMEKCSKIAKQPTDKPDVLVAAVEKLKEEALPDSIVTKKTHPNLCTLLVKTISNKNKVQESVRMINVDEFKKGIKITKSIFDENISIGCENKNLEKKREQKNKQSLFNVNLEHGNVCTYIRRPNCKFHILRVVYTSKIS